MGWDIRISSIAMSNKEKSKWPSIYELCPQCSEPFSWRKKFRHENKVVTHRLCAKRYALDNDLERYFIVCGVPLKDR